MLAHIEHFCIDSDWSDPVMKKDSLRKQYLAEVRRDSISQKTVGWEEVHMYLRRENYGRYISDERKRQREQRSIVGHCTLQTLRDHFREDTDEFGFLRDHIGDEKNEALIEHLEILKHKRELVRNLKDKEERRVLHSDNHYFHHKHHSPKKYNYDDRVWRMGGGKYYSVGHFGLASGIEQHKEKHQTKKIAYLQKLNEEEKEKTAKLKASTRRKSPRRKKN